MSQRPVAIGLLFCENVVVEEGTRNLTPVNCFTKRTFKDFPAPLSFAVVGFLTDGMGRIELGLRIQSMDNMEEILERNFVVQFRSPLQEVRLLYRVKDLVIHGAASFLVTLLADGEMAAQRKFRADLRGGTA